MLFLNTILFFVDICEGAGEILVVQLDNDDNYSSIQDAVNAAAVNDTVFVKSGFYFETIVIDKSILLVGEDKNDTIISNNYSGFYAVFIKNSNVNLSGFTIKNSTVGIFLEGNDSIENVKIFDNILTNNKGGIYLGNGSNNNLIFKNLLFENDGDGIRLYKSFENKIFDNNITKQNSYGLILWDSSCNNNISNNFVYSNKNGIGIRRWSDNNFVNSNNISNNINLGLNLGFSYENTIINNEIFSNNNGILISDSFNNNISKNTFKYNHKAVYLYDSKNNSIDDYNTFIENDEDISEGSKSFETPGFGLILVLLSICFKIFKKKRNLQ